MVSISNNTKTFEVSLAGLVKGTYNQQDLYEDWSDFDDIKVSDPRTVPVVANRE